MSAGSESPSLSLLELSLSLLGPSLILVLCHVLHLRITKRIVIVLLRTVVQLWFAGYILLGFIFSMKSPVYVFCYLLLMVMISSYEVTSRQTRTYRGYLRDSFLCVAVGGGLVGLYGSLVVFRTSPWWQPHILVPTAGMLIGNSISGPALAVERLFSEVCDRSHEVELRLAFGGNKYEATLPTMQAALLAALTPTLNQMAVVGIVSIPGMMTGQLLAGASPLVAAEYQLAILWLILAASGLSTLIGLYLGLRAVFDEGHRILAHKITKKEKSSVDAALINLCSEIGSFLCCDQSKSRHTNSPSSLEKTSLLNSPQITLEMGNTKSERNGVITVAFEIIAGSTPNITVEGEPFFRVVDFNVCFLGKKNLPFFCNDVTFSMKKGEIMTLEGASGVGKSMFLRSLALFDKPKSGTLSLCTKNRVLNSSSTEVPTWRKHCMYVPQAVPPLHGTPIAFIKEVSKYDSRNSKINFPDIDALCSEMEEELLLGLNKLSTEWVKLSGGERQRAAIACALVLVRLEDMEVSRELYFQRSEQEHKGLLSDQETKKKFCNTILLFDEPTAACDATSTTAVERALVRSGATIILTTHDPRQSFRIAQRRMLFLDESKA